MPGSLDARYRVFIHNPPGLDREGHPALRFQHGPQRAGSMEWRTNDYDAACRKAVRILKGEDKDNALTEGGWLSVQENTNGEWRLVIIVE